MSLRFNQYPEYEYVFIDLILHSLVPYESGAFSLEEGRIAPMSFLTQACRKRQLFGVFGNVINYFLIMFLSYQICAT